MRKWGLLFEIGVMRRCSGLIYFNWIVICELIVIGHSFSKILILNCLFKIDQIWKNYGAYLVNTYQKLMMVTICILKMNIFSQNSMKQALYLLIVILKILLII